MQEIYVGVAHNHSVDRKVFTAPSPVKSGEANLGSFLFLVRRWPPFSSSLSPPHIQPQHTQNSTKVSVMRSRDAKLLLLPPAGSSWGSKCEVGFPAHPQPRDRDAQLPGMVAIALHCRPTTGMSKMVPLIPLTISASQPIMVGHQKNHTRLRDSVCQALPRWQASTPLF